MCFICINLGLEGFKLFFDIYKCNDVCKYLGLVVGIVGCIILGIYVGKYWWKLNILG